MPSNSSRPVPYPVCILAGGLGSRLGSRVQHTPKPLLEVAGRPFVLHQLELLSAYCVGRVVLCVGYLGEQIEAAVGHQRFGITIGYSYDRPGLDGTLGAVRRALPHLGEQFLASTATPFFSPITPTPPLAGRRVGCPGMMTVLRNESHWETSNVEFADTRVVRYDKSLPTPAMRWIDYGPGGLTVEALRVVDDAVSDLADLQRELARRRLLVGVEATERFHDIGTPEALEETERFLLSRFGSRS